MGKTFEIKYNVSLLAYVRTVNVLAIFPPKLSITVRNDKFPVDLFL